MGRALNSASRHPGRTAAALLSAGVLFTSGVGYAAAYHYTGKIEHVPVFAGLASAAGQEPADTSEMTVLLVGSDDRTGLSEKRRRKLHVGQDDYGRHTDSMMLVHVNRDNEVSVVSIPRDSLADIPAYTAEDGTMTQASQEKINAAYSIGGPELAVQTVEDATGVTIDHYAEVNFAGFVEMVNALGGVPVCTQTPIQDEKSGLDLPAGRSVLNGRQGLAYVRARYFDPTSDLGRMKRQQAFVASMFKKASSPTVLLNPVRFNSFLDAGISSIKTDDGLGRPQLMKLAQRLGGVDPSAVKFQTVPISGEAELPGVGSVVTWDEPKAQALFAEMSGESAPKPTQTPTPTVDPSMITVKVLNGGGVQGMGGTAAQDFKDAGFSVPEYAQDAQTPTGTQTVIEYDPSNVTALATLQAALPDAEVREMPGLGTEFRVTVGSAYAGLAASYGTASASASPTADPSAGETEKPRTAADDLCG